MSNNPGNYGLSLYGMDPYGSDFAIYGVAGATSYGPHYVQVRFTDLINLLNPVYTDPSNYIITPTLAVHAVVIESADSVILETDAQSFVTYTVTVTSGDSFYGIPMVPPNNTATFTGFPLAFGYFSLGTSPTRVRCIFSQPMTVNAALTDPASYTVTDLNNNVLPILSAQIEQQLGGEIPVSSVVLTLGVPMQTTQWYQTILGPGIVDVYGQPPKPSTYDFQWVLPVQNVTVPIEEFSGEVVGGPFGNHNGLVFFSPSLNVAASSSIIQVEEVSVCTTAYDQYHFPQAFDPRPFYIWSQPPNPQTFLGEAGVVLFAGFPYLSEAQFQLEFTPTHLFDTMPEAFDGSCSIVIRAGFAPGYVALLNDLAYWLFDGILADTTTPPMFICANNGGPIPVGPETIIVLHQALVGYATMTVQEPQLVHWAEATIHADSHLATVPEIVASISANSYMRVGRSQSNHGATVVPIVGGSSMSVFVPEAITAEADITGYATVRAHVEQDWQAAATLEGVADIFTRARVNQPISAAIHAGSSATGTATKGPVANAAIVAGASVTAHAVRNHTASASLSGHSTVAATPS